jgi:hypothetical protein
MVGASQPRFIAGLSARGPHGDQRHQDEKSDLNLHVWQHSRLNDSSAPSINRSAVIDVPEQASPRLFKLI